MQKISTEKLEEILSCWRELQSLHQISKNTGISRTTIRRYLSKHGEETNPNPPKRATNEEKQKIRQAYLLGESISKIVKRTQIGKGSIIKILKENGLTIKNPGFEKKYKVNHQVFSKETPKRNYFVGLLAADGNLSKKGWFIKIELHKQDVDILQELKKFLGTNAPIKDRKKKEKITYKRITITSKEIWEDLKLLGLKPQKARTVEPHKTLRHDPNFWRGIIDGDGHLKIYTRKRKNGKLARPQPQLHMAGNPAMAKTFSKFCARVLKKKINDSKGEKPWNRNVRLYGEDAKIITKLLYNNEDPSITRKKKTATQIMGWERINPRRKTWKSKQKT